MVSWPYVCRHITECSYPPPPLPRCELLCSDVLISYYRAPSCTNRRSLSYQSHSIWHSGTDLISQHLVLTSVTPSRTDLAASRAIDSHHVSHQSPQHLVPISQHLAPISQHLVPLVPISHDLTYKPSTIWTDLAAPSRTDLVAPSCTDLAAPSRADLVALSCTDLAASCTGLALPSRADLAARTDPVAPSRAGLTAPSRATISHCPRSTVAWQWAVHGACWRPHS